MAYTARTITDRIADGDDCFYMEQLPDGRVRLIPAPNSVTEPGTDINKAILQLIEDRVVLLMNRVFDDINGYPFTILFDTLDKVTVNGVWNESMTRIEC